LETTELRLRKVKKEGVAVVKFGVNEKGCDGASSGKVESVSYPSKIAHRYKAKFRNYEARHRECRIKNTSRLSWSNSD